MSWNMMQIVVAAKSVQTCGKLRFDMSFYITEQDRYQCDTCKKDQVPSNQITSKSGDMCNVARA